MCVIAWEFCKDALDENLVENTDKTHFVINMDNNKTLVFTSDKIVKYVDMVSSRLGIT